MLVVQGLRGRFWSTSHTMLLHGGYGLFSLWNFHCTCVLAVVAILVCVKAIIFSHVLWGPSYSTTVSQCLKVEWCEIKLRDHVVRWRCDCVLTKLVRSNVSMWSAVMPFSLLHHWTSDIIIIHYWPLQRLSPPPETSGKFGFPLFPCFPTLLLTCTITVRIPLGFPGLY